MGHRGIFLCHGWAKMLLDSPKHGNMPRLGVQELTYHGIITHQCFPKVLRSRLRPLQNTFVVALLQFSWRRPISRVCHHYTHSCYWPTPLIAITSSASIGQSQQCNASAFVFAAADSADVSQSAELSTNKSEGKAQHIEH